MNLVNAKIRLDPERLFLPLRPVHVSQLHSAVFELENVPDDVTSIVMRVFKLDGVSHFDLPGSRCPSGDAIVYAIGTVFPEAGDARYEIHAYDFKGNPTALGSGTLSTAMAHNGTASSTATGKADAALPDLPAAAPAAPKAP